MVDSSELEMISECLGKPDRVVLGRTNNLYYLFYVNNAGDDGVQIHCYSGKQHVVKPVGSYIYAKDEIWRTELSQFLDIDKIPENKEIYFSNIAINEIDTRQGLPHHFIELLIESIRTRDEVHIVRFSHTGLKIKGLYDKLGYQDLDLIPGKTIPFWSAGDTGWMYKLHGVERNRESIDLVAQAF